MKKLTHVDAYGRARMVDVTKKSDTLRKATASAVVRLSGEAFRQLKNNQIAKGDVLTVAKTAGIMAAKKTSELIPLCHPVPLTHVDLELALHAETRSVRLKASATTTHKTGVEMEALTAVSVAALTIYDMCKAIDKGIEIGEIVLLRKEGGRSGVYQRKKQNKK
ncbi:cyclic pyranopterin monophosphate synthase MoaC [bacterium]|nr:cyclic pyranopterin monophosphate synthase MoaC [bacterium]